MPSDLCRKEFRVWRTRQFTRAGVVCGLAAFALTVAWRAAAPAAMAAPDCGEELLPAALYQQVAYYSLAAACGLFFACTLLDNKKARIGLGAAAGLSLLTWACVYFFVDFDAQQNKAFAYNMQAERTLANLAEAQERYKSEHGAYAQDLDSLSIHIAGASGHDRCVEVLELKLQDGHWAAQARQMRSPDTILWDSRKGSSLKKG